MKQKKSTKKFLKSVAKPKHGKEEPKKSFGKKKAKKQGDEPVEFSREERTINLKQPTTSGKGSIKR